ncbi:MAG: prolipoprotein diacylglyceryl transferase [Lentimicrobium sp.]
MKTFFIISDPHNGFYYAFFYGVAFLAAAGIFIYQGLRNHYAPRTWLIIALFGILSGIFGNKIVTIDAAGWAQLFRGGSMPESGRSVLGLILGLIAGVMLAKRWLRFDKPVLDHLAYALPAGMAVARLGCLLGGCCYGTPTQLPWAIQYGPASRAFQFHTDQLFIPASGALSLPVHPTQVYDILCCLFIIYLTWLTRKYWKAPGNRFVFVTALYASFRFVLEFVRQSPGDGFIFETFLGIKTLQWILLGTTVLMALFLILRESRAVTRNFIASTARPVSLKREFFLFALILILVPMISGWLDPFEKMVIYLFTVPILLLFAGEIYFRMTVPGLRWKAPIILLFAGLSLGQTGLDQESGQKLSKNKGWLSTDVFGGLGSYPDKIYDCEGRLTDILERNYSNWGAGITYHYKPRNEWHLRASMNLYSSGDWSDEPYQSDYRSPAMNTMVNFNMKYGGGTLGMNVFFDEHWISDIVPVGDIWVGRRDVLFAEARFMSDYHFLGPPGIFQVGVGSGFGQYDKNLGRFGISLSPAFYGFLDSKLYVMGVYFGSDFLIKDRMTIRGNLYIGNYFGASVGAQFHLGQKRWVAVRE